MSNGATSREPPLVHREKDAANLLKLVREMLVELHPAQRAQLQVQLDNTLDYDLGFDSLSRVELVARIEKHFGVSLPVRTLQEAETPRDLLMALQAATQTRAVWSADDLLEEDLGTAEPAPDHAHTLLEVLEWHVRHHPDRTHIRFYSDEGTGSTLSYRQLFEGAKEVATGLQQSGVAPSQAVAMMLPTGDWAIHRHRGTLSAAPNFAYKLCLHRIKGEDIEGLDLSSWRLSFNGAESVNPETVTGFCTRFAPFGFTSTTMFPVYGLAESAVGLAFPPLGREPLIDRVDRETFMLTGEARPTTSTNSGLRFVACGQPLAGHEIRIVDSSDRELSERLEGRLQFLGPSTTSGYFRNAKATAELFHGDWLDSGDQAYIAAGDVYLTGRVKDIIIRAGRNIYPHELEESVSDIPGIRRGRVAVFGDHDPVSGTEHLVVMAETRLPEQEQEPLRMAVNHIVTSLAGDPPEQVVLTPPGTILKTSSGKIRRAASHELYRTGHIGPKAAALWHQIARLALKALLKKGSRAFSAMAEWAYAGYAWFLFLVAVILGWPLALLLPTFELRWKIMGEH